jgi:hypothetical protein
VPRELYHDSLIFFHADGRRRYVWVPCRCGERAFLWIETDLK